MAFAGGRSQQKPQWKLPQTTDSAKFKRNPKRSSPSQGAVKLFNISGLRKTSLPDFVEPALALLLKQPPAGENWLHEIKFDGYRLQARLDGRKVKLLTRKGLDWTPRFPPIAQVLQSVQVSNAVLDGELIVQDEGGVSSFSGLQSDLKGKRHGRMIYMVFDLLHLNGFNLMGASQLDRKDALKAVLNNLPSNSPVRYSEHLKTGTPQLLRNACGMGLEGIVSKQADAPYVSGRSGQWIKSKCNMRQEFVVVGYVPSEASQLAIGSLVLAYYEKDVLVHVGRVGTGFSNNLAIDLKKTLNAIAAPQPQFKSVVAPANRRGVVWVKPKLVAEVEFRGWSSDNLLRQASFKGLREDKPAKEIRREQ
jgi:bifunctional non-homologous end joining protein LigD